MDFHVTTYNVESQRDLIYQSFFIQNSFIIKTYGVILAHSVFGKFMWHLLRGFKYLFNSTAHS